jgi:hypothetical protein
MRTGRDNKGKVENTEGGSRRLCRLRIVSVGPLATGIDYVLMHTGYMEPHKLSSFDGRRVGR